MDFFVPAKSLSQRPATCRAGPPVDQRDLREPVLSGTVPRHAWNIRQDLGMGIETWTDGRDGRRRQVPRDFPIMQRIPATTLRRDLHDVPRAFLGYGCSMRGYQRAVGQPAGLGSM